MNTMHHTTTIKDKPRAYSYLRFSTPEQSKGDSFRRQTAMALKYASVHGLALDTALTFHDLGVSAFKGVNAETGRLADFLEAVKVGLVPQGSFLLVEALDRVSRMTVRKAMRVLEAIVDAGVTLVTLNDGRSYSADSLDKDPMELMIAITLFMRANDESVNKARRLSAAWEGKRINALGKPLTSLTPAWVKLDRAGDKPVLSLIPERAAVVRRIFADYLAGQGQGTIAQQLTEEGMACFGTAKYWHRSYISKILKNPATCGTYSPHKMQQVGGKSVRVPLPPIDGYFPPAVSRETFDACQALGFTAHTIRPRQGQLVNLLGGLAVCPVCGGTMTRVSKGPLKGGKPKLVCVRAKKGMGCDYVGVQVEDVEAVLVSKVEQFLASAPAGDVEAEGKLAALEAGIDATIEQIRNLTDALATGASPAIAGRIRELELGLVEAQRDKEALERKLEATSSPVVSHRLLEVERSLLAEPMDKAQANAALRSVLRGVVVDYLTGELRFQWKHGGESALVYGWPRNPRT